MRIPKHTSVPTTKTNKQPDATSVADYPQANLFIQRTLGTARPQSGGRLSPHQVLTLQRSIGNRAVTRLLAQQKQIGTSPVLQRTLENNPLAVKTIQRDKRKRDDSDEDLPPTKKQRTNPDESLSPVMTDDPGEDFEFDGDFIYDPVKPEEDSDISTDEPEDADMMDLTERFSQLSISFESPIDNGEHKIYPQDNLQDVMIESDPTPLARIVTQGFWLGKAFTTTEMTVLMNHQTSIQKALTALKKGVTKKKNEDLRLAMYATSKFLKLKGGIKIPKTDLSNSTYYGSTSPDIVGKNVEANPLSSRTDDAGSSPTDSNLMTELRDKIVKNGGKSQDPVQAHLLNMKTWGPGALWNLTPASKQFNTDMESKLEEPLKEAIIDAHLVLYFEAEVNYRNHPVGTDYKANPEKYLFTSIDFSAYQLHEDVVQGTFVQDGSIPNHPLVKKLNQTMKWDQGNFPVLEEKPQIHFETDPAKFTDIGLNPSVAEALATLNKAVAKKVIDRKNFWNANVAQKKLIDYLKMWLKDDNYTGTRKRITWGDPPANWKQLIDWAKP